MRTNRASYYRRNPLSDTELIIGGVVAAALVGVGGYFVYNHFQAAASAANPGAGLPAANATLASATLPTVPYDPNNPATYGGPGTPSTAIPPSS